MHVTETLYSQKQPIDAGFSYDKPQADVFRRVAESLVWAHHLLMTRVNPSGTEFEVRYQLGSTMSTGFRLTGTPDELRPFIIMVGFWRVWLNGTIWRQAQKTWDQWPDRPADAPRLTDALQPNSITVWGGWSGAVLCAVGLRPTHELLTRDPDDVVVRPVGEIVDLALPHL